MYLTDLACVSDNQNSIASEGGIPALVNLLDSELEDVLVNAVNAIRVMCTGNKENQTAVSANGGIEPLVEFLTVQSGNYRSLILLLTVVHNTTTELFYSSCMSFRVRLSRTLSVFSITILV